MSAYSQRLKGIAINGKIELEPGTNLPDGAEVTVLFEQPEQPYTVNRDQAIDRLFKAMDEGLTLGGGPYVDRPQFYGDTGRPH